MRAFIGVDFSKEFKNEIGELQNLLKPHSIKGRWKYIDNFHITLKFLEELREDQVEGLIRKLKTITPNYSPFELEATKLGTFKGGGLIRVLWMGLGGDLQSLENIKKNIDEGLIDIGFQKEARAFKPHITIGQDLVFEDKFEIVEKGMDLSHFPKIYVDRLFLFKSEQVGKKRVYTKIEEFLM